MGKNNVIQFPGSKKPSSSTPNPQPSPPRRALVIGLSLLAIALAASAANNSVFSATAGQADFASFKTGPNGRRIASIEPMKQVRDANWEKKLAESLASRKVRDVASVAIGRQPTLSERLQNQMLDNDYTILRDLDNNEVNSIVFASTDAQPTYVLDRQHFLDQYGRVVSHSYGFAELKSSRVVGDRRMESYTVFDASRRPYAVAKFELDNYQRLLSFHFDRSK